MYDMYARDVVDVPSFFWISFLFPRTTLAQARTNSPIAGTHTNIWRKRKRGDHTLSYADALAKTASDSIEAIVRKNGGYCLRDS